MTPSKYFSLLAPIFVQPSGAVILAADSPPRAEVQIAFPEHEIAFGLCELPVFLVVPGVELQVNHEIGRFEVTLGELVFVRAIFSLDAMRRLWCGDVVLNDVPEFYGRQRITVLDAGLDVDKSFADRVVSLNGIGQQVFQHLTVIPVL